MKSVKVSKLLRQAWSRQRNKDPKDWSLRQIARELNLSPGYLSKIFSGQKAISKDLAKKIILTLKIDDLTKQVILNAYSARSENLKSPRLMAAKKKVSLDEYELPHEAAEWLLQRWYNMAILDMMTLSGFKNDPQWIASRLKISAHEAERSLKQLISENLAIMDESGNCQKRYLKIRFPSTISKKCIREYHKEQMKRAIDIMETQLLPKDFNNRMIIGLSVASNLENLQKAKTLLHEALYEAAEILSEGNCTEIYQLNIQVFPQTKIKP